MNLEKALSGLTDVFSLVIGLRPHAGRPAEDRMNSSSTSEIDVPPTAQGLTAKAKE
jgi:hypothetical protein